MGKLIESLEARRLLAFSASQSGGNLIVSSGGSNEEMHVVEDNGSVHVYGADFSNEQFFNGVTGIDIRGNTGNDTIFYEGNTVGAVIKGNAGADHISVIDKGTGASNVSGDADNDQITLVVANTSGGKTTLDGGSGDDAIFVNTGYSVDPNLYNYASAQCLVICSSGADTVSTYAGTTTVNGGSGSDTVIEFTGSGPNTYINVEFVVTP